MCCDFFAICDLSGFPLLERHEGIAVGDSLYAELQLEHREAAYTPDALLASNRDRLIWFKMHKIFCRLNKYCDTYQCSPEFSDRHI